MKLAAMKKKKQSPFTFPLMSNEGRADTKVNIARFSKVNVVQPIGHHLKENKVVEHPYFGTDLVLESLKDVDANGWEQGYINMKEGVHKTLRDQETGLIVGMTTSKPKSNMGNYCCRSRKREPIFEGRDGQPISATQIQEEIR